MANEGDEDVDYTENHETSQVVLIQQLNLSNELLHTFLEWRHKVIVRFFVAVGAIFIAIAWIIDAGQQAVSPLSSAWSLVIAGLICFIGAGFSYLSFRFDQINGEVINIAYRVGSQSERLLHMGSRGLLTALFHRSLSKDQQAPKSGSYRHLLKFLYIGGVGVFLIAGIVLVSVGAAMI